MLITHPVPGFASVISSEVFGFSADRVELTPGVSLETVQSALFLFGKLLVGNKFFHLQIILNVVGIIISNPQRDL